MDEVIAPQDVTSTTSEPISFINPDGSYKEGWKDTLLPEDLRTEKFYDSPFNANVKELLKTAGNQAKMLGKKGVIPINEKSNEFEVKEYRKALGVPDKYAYSKPELKSLEVKDEFINTALDKFNKEHMTQKQVDTAMGVFNEYIKGLETEYEKEELDTSAKINQEILQNENTDYEVNSHYIDNVVRRFTQGWAGEEIMKLFGTVDSKDGINNKDHIEMKPLLRKFLVGVGKAMGEGKSVIGETGGKSLQEQLDELMKTPEYMTSTNPKAHKEATEKGLRLREQINKSIGRV